MIVSKVIYCCQGSEMTLANGGDTGRVLTL